MSRMTLTGPRTKSWSATELKVRLRGLEEFSTPSRQGGGYERATEQPSADLSARLRE